MGDVLFIHQSLHALAHVPGRCAIAAWTKPFAVFKPPVNPAYTWEPVIFSEAERETEAEPPSGPSVAFDHVEEGSGRASRPRLRFGFSTCSG